MALPVSVFLLLQAFVIISGYTVSVEEKSITCWTCPNKGSNLECNDWAPDRYCPQGQSVCQTVHTFSDVTGQVASVRVNKQCVDPEKCTRHDVGCRTDKTTNTKTCISCCTTSYCNEEVAHDNNSAIRFSVTLFGSAACNKLTYWPVFILGYLAMLMVDI
ncbi:ly6/PLAUR domain-containing protein 6B-like [Liolophura sinensis]|uniref:ly6/PLAUR domain-containing protein 6B-like n=1 Tax=Liolophura sinensis TaxID=3198878 RepID=UPI003158CBFD